MSNLKVIKSQVKKSLAVVLLTYLSLPVFAQLNDSVIHKSVVRVQVEKDSNVGMASGFVWQENDMVITSLHAIRPKATITVLCNNVPYGASVYKILKDADLVLLKTEAALSDCTALNRFDPNKPSARSELVAFGFKPSVNASTAKDLKKASASNETLKDLISENMRIPMQNLSMPSIDLPVYFVTGGIYKGFSGGPVMDTQGNLIGIVEGGLDKGTSDHNWLIPAANIDRLLASSVVSDIPFDLDDQAHFFSAVVTRESKPESFIQFVFDDVEYDWMKTKTRTFEALLQTSSPAQGLEELWSSIIPEVVTSAEQNLAFDIYEEEKLGLIIAIPKGIKLTYEVEGQDWTLTAQDTAGEQAVISVKHGNHAFTDENGNIVSPSHPDYLEYQVDMVMLICEQENISCELQDEHFRMVDFGNGNRILRMGYIFNDEISKSAAYIYNSIVVKGNDVLIVETLLNFGADSAVLKCLEGGKKEDCGASFWEPASFMLATALTSFSSLAIDNVEPIVTTYDYDCENCTETTNDVDPESSAQTHVNSEQEGQVPDYGVSLGYFDNNNNQIFLYSVNDGWSVNFSDEYYLATEERREMWSNGAEYAILTVGEYVFAVPIVGGPYFNMIEGGSWQELGIVVLN